MFYIQLNDLNMHYYDNQQSDKSTLFFVHGLGENLESWMYQLQHFDHNYRVIAIDLRGHGKSDDGFLPLTITQMAQDIINLIDQLQLAKVHIIGLSMGGMIGLELTKKHQARLSSLTLANTMAYPLDTNKITLQDRINFLDSLSMENIAEYTTNKCLARENNKHLHDQVYKMFFNNRLLPYTAATIAVFSIDYRPDLAKIEIPTLIIAGELDVITPVSYAAYLQKNIRNSNLVIIKHAGHLSKLEQPEQFNLALDNHISSSASITTPVIPSP